MSEGAVNCSVFHRSCRKLSTSQFRRWCRNSQARTLRFVPAAGKEPCARFAWYRKDLVPVDMKFCIHRGSSLHTDLDWLAAIDSLFATGNKVIWMIAPSTLSKLIEEQQERCAQTWRYLAGSYYNMPHVNKFGYPDAFFCLYELNFRSMRVINLENLHIPMQQGNCIKILDL